MCNLEFPLPKEKFNTLSSSSPLCNYSFLFSKSFNVIWLAGLQVASQKPSCPASLWAQRALPWVMSYWCVKADGWFVCFFSPPPISMQRSTKKKVTKNAERNLSFFDSWSCFSLVYISPFSLMLAAKGNLKHLISKPVGKQTNKKSGFFGAVMCTALILQWNGIFVWGDDEKGGD